MQSTNPDVSNEGPEHNPLVRQARHDGHSLRLAIDAMCAHCMGCTMEEINPGFRTFIRECTSPKCPLFAVRPYQTIRVRKKK